MHRFGLGLIVCCLVINSELHAQPFPADSPPATTIQRVGLDDITITYSRPGVKGRTIFGELVPFGSVWRTGANKPTLITFTDTTSIEKSQTRIHPGTYALYTIPGKDQWTIIFSKTTTLWGAYGYDQTNDALRVTVPSKTDNPFKETFLIHFNEVTDHSAQVVLEWERTRVSFTVSVDIKDRILAGMREKLASTDQADWSVYLSGARYLLNNQLELPLALTWIEQSIAIREEYNNLWIKAQILAAQNRYPEAIQAGEKALKKGTTGENAPYFPYEAVYRTEIGKWKAKVK